MLGTVAVGVVRESRKFRAPIYRAHRAVIFATAQLSRYCIGPTCADAVDLTK